MVSSRSEIFQLQFFFRIVLCLVTNGAERLLNTSFDSKFKLAFWSSSSRCLRMSSACAFWASASFVVLRFHDGLKFCKFSGLAFEFVGDQSASLIGFFAGNRLPFPANAFLDLSVDLLPGRGH